MLVCCGGVTGSGQCGLFVIWVWGSVILIEEGLWCEAGREALLVQIPLGKEGPHQTEFPCLSSTPEETADLACTPAEPAAPTLSFPSQLLASWRLPAAAAE